MQKYGFDKNKDLICGENIHQNAELYNAEFQAGYDVLGEELTYCEICDATLATDIVAEFYDVPAVTIVKMQAACGVALGKDIFDAYQKALDCDPINAFESIIVASNTITEEVAQNMILVAPKVVIAPNFDTIAIEILKKTSKIVKLNTKLQDYKKLNNKEIKVTPFGILVQDKDTKELDKDTFKVATKTKPTAEQIEDAVFAWKIAKHTKSHAVIVAKNFRTYSIVQRQNNLTSSIELALDKACDESKDAILACDSPFTSIENVQDITQGRIALVIQPAKHNQDEKVIAEADKYKLAMITTGIKHTKY